jgi:hemerythrin-like domain-containing protein
VAGCGASGYAAWSASQLWELIVVPCFAGQCVNHELVFVVENPRGGHNFAGRDVTDIILRFSTGNEFVKPESQRQLVIAVRQFIRRYRPHEAREDTVLFPTFRKIVSADRIKELGDQFENEENRLFGNEGFEKTVNQVAEIEKQLGIYQLSQFTPVLPRK